ncbi:MAG: hypothetical protein C0603_10175 [Denitrovibrio sp.]|nr:MAG: hypothetical protein C0603_10175 [Denitrovibrio sp.]
MTLLEVLDIIGTVAFAASGAIAGVRKNLDLYGVCFLAIITAVGGGTVRDALLGRVPPFVFTDIKYFILSIVTAFLVFFFYKLINKTYAKLVWFDALGLGVFNVIGITIALDAGVGYFGSIVFGVITGTVGGMMRDVLIGVTPFVLKREVYATACIVAGLLFCIFDYIGMNTQLNMLISSIFLFSVRMITFRMDINMPVIKQ